MSSFGSFGSGSFDASFASGSAIASGSGLAVSGSAIATSASGLYDSSFAASGSYASAPAIAAAPLALAAPVATYSRAYAAAPLATRSFAAAPLATRSFAAAPAAALATRTIAAAPAVAVAAPVALAQNFAVPDNVDAHPLIVRKKPAAPVNYTQQVSVKFLQPPPPQQPGDIVITQQKDVQAAPVAPRLIRQKPPLPVKPAPLVVRERPPLAPAPIAPEHHVIPGKVIPPPPRKVVIERLPQLPQPPQDIIVERWLEYGPRARRVVFRPAPRLIPAPAPKNVLIQWDSPNVALNRQFRNLGIAAASPAQYVATFGASLVPASAVPALSRGIRPANGARLAAEHPPHPVRLVGDVAALSLINRARHLAAPAVVAAAAPAISYRAAAPAIVAAAPAISYAAAAPAISYAAAAPSYLSGSALASGSGLAYNSNLIGASNAYAYDSALASGSAIAASGSALASGSYSF
jgi:hypothetical protein